MNKLSISKSINFLDFECRVMNIIFLFAIYITHALICLISDINLSTYNSSKLKWIKIFRA